MEDAQAEFLGVQWADPRLDITADIVAIVDQPAK
jgi:hypothetical protein